MDFKLASERIFNVAEGKISKKKAFLWENAVQTWWIYFTCCVYRPQETHVKIKQWAVGCALV